MSGIESSHVVITTYRDSDGNEGIARVEKAVNGCAFRVRLVNMGPCGSYWLCRHKDDPTNDYILLLPSAKWEQDARDDGYELVQKLNQRTP